MPMKTLVPMTLVAATLTYDIFFDPEAPEGMEDNWVQTIPGKGWNMLFRLYGPLEAWFDKTWRPGDAVPVE